MSFCKCCLCFLTTVIPCVDIGRDVSDYVLVLIYCWYLCEIWLFFSFSLKYDLDRIEWCKKILVANINYSGGGFIDDPQKCWDQGLVVVVGDRIRRRQVLLGFSLVNVVFLLLTLKYRLVVWTCFFVFFL